MDNKLNEIRRKIKFLRAEMLGAEDNSANGQPRRGLL